MRRLSVKVCLFFLATVCFAQTKPLYQLPDVPLNVNDSENPFLIGTDGGLFRVISENELEPVWTRGKVSQIIKANSYWYFVTANGIIRSLNLHDFEECNTGLPTLTIKKYAEKQKSLEVQTALLKDICADPLDPNILVTATKDSVYLTRDGGKNWKSIGSTSQYTSGIKSVAVAHMPVYAKDGSIASSEVVVFMSHAIYGFSYYRADAARPAWIDVSAGFTALPTLTPDEVSDIVPVVCSAEDDSLFVEIYCAQTFLPNIYRFDWKNKRAQKVYAGSEALDTIDGLCQNKNELVFTTVGKLASISLQTGEVSELPSPYLDWKQQLLLSDFPVNAAYVPNAVSKMETPLSLSELWLLTPNEPLTPWGEKADSRKAVYISSYQVRNMAGIQKYKNIVSKNKLNAVVVDMKDDYGLLRFEPNSPLLKQKGFVTQYKIDVETFVDEFKKDDVYLIGRIVVFKDKHLSEYDKGQYAVWNAKTNRPWVGIRGTEDVTDEAGNTTQRTRYYDENWVDPYSEEVWEYNVEIAKELIERGFDEIQFDYIRFPTDGTNLSNATYRWRDKGMDKESALVSFLSYARENIKAPIGIDIYGANGWYRSGTRTGQDVELMSEYVDVICPMFYPSHFEQNFLEYKPLAERPYRIYFYGTYRNTVIGRNHIVVRPWVQAFYMNVRYDRTYYNSDYVLREIFGVRDGADHGYMFWNNSGGNYDDIRPDPADNEISPWKADEEPQQTRLPAFSYDDSEEKLYLQNKSLSKAAERSQAMLSILDSVLNPEYEEEAPAQPAHNIRFLHILPITGFLR